MPLDTIQKKCKENALLSQTPLSFFRHNLLHTPPIQPTNAVQFAQTILVVLTLPLMAKIATCAGMHTEKPLLPEKPQACATILSLPLHFPFHPDVKQSPATPPNCLMMQSIWQKKAMWPLSFGT